MSNKALWPDGIYWTGLDSDGCRFTGVITSICASELRRGPDQRAGTASI